MDNQSRFRPAVERRRILLIEDEFINLEILKMYLTDDYELITAQTGREALDIMRDQYEIISLILLDLNLPDIHGLDVLRDEPPVSDNPLFHTDKTSITGHIAWLTKESRLRAVDMAIENFIHYLNAIPTSVIN